mmetsp:Transcript_7330/g.20375  ORF Transcript_7330/g.20375 Transcript_7330/m.20375 type:complete len:809 (+) Transcript_7330:79-2505(+)
MGYSTQLLLRINIVAALSLSASTFALSWNGGRTRCIGDGHVRSACMFMTDPARDSTLKAFDVQAVDAPTLSSTSKPIDKRRSNKSTARRRKSSRQRKPPAVDSTLLRFIGQQKDFFVAVPLLEAVEKAKRPKQQSPFPLQESSPYQTVVDETTREFAGTTEGTSANSTTINGSGLSQTRSAAALDDSTSSSDDTTKFSNFSDDQLQNEIIGWGQYNSHRVQSILLSMDETLDKSAVAKAGARVQAQVLARTIRRRIRTFLKQRDQCWKTRSSSSSDPSVASSPGGKGAVAASASMKMMMMIENGYAPICVGHSLEESIEVMANHGLTAKDITDILQHSPGITLMRPRGISSDVDDNLGSVSIEDTTIENGECLDHTLDRVFKLLCVTLKLRKYDARKIVRSSPGLLTMRGSKSAEAIVALFHRMGVSHNALARDKAALSVTLLRSPSAIFRLVAFLSSDAIRMPVGKIGPLLRRPLARKLLDAVAPIPQQSLSSISSSSTNSTYGEEAPTSDAPREALESDLDPWIVSALWGKQCQIRRDQTNAIYKQMTKTAWTLRNEIGTADLSKVVCAYPSVLILDAETHILPHAEYLMENLGICEGDLPRVLQLYPRLLALPSQQMGAVANYIESLGVERESLSSMFRAFPALLTLDIEDDMKPVVAFLHSIGVVDIGRFLIRIPPVLGYSVEKELVPKWKHLKTVSTDARFEVTKFPAYFSYPLERVIKARYEYIQDVKRFPTQLISVEKVVSYGDNDFATKVLRDSDGGDGFRNFLDRRKKTFQSNKRKKNQPRPNQFHQRDKGETVAVDPR